MKTLRLLVMASCVLAAASPAFADWQTIMSENFEGAFPSGLWSVSGNPTWDDDDYNPHSGGWCCWCANGGAGGLDPQFNNYPHNMNATMTYGPFDLSGAVRARLTYWMWLYVEGSRDFVRVRASSDGSNWTGDTYTGGNATWLSYSLNLDSYCGQPQVWISFNFTSDSSIAYNGAFIDDVLLVKEAYPPITIDGPAVDGQIDNAYDIDIYRLTVANFGDYWVETTNTWGTLTSSSMDLCDSGFTLIANSLGTGDGGMSRILGSRHPGMYYVQVKGANGSTGTYHVTVSNSRNLQVGSWASGNIAGAGALNCYQCNIPAAGVYVIDTVAGSLSDTYMHLYDIDRDDPIEEDDDDGDGNAARIIRFLPQGWCHVKVRAYNHDATGTYSIRIAQATPLTPDGAGVTGNVTAPGQADWYQLVISAHGDYVIETTNAWGGTLADTTLSLCNSSGVELQADDNGGDGNMSRIVHTLNAGTYYLRVKGDATGTYRITASSVFTVAPLTQALGEIASFSSVWCKLIITTPGYYRIELLDLSHYSGGYLCLYDSACNEFLEDDEHDGEGGLPRIVRLLSAGTYYVRLRTGIGAPGSYTLLVAEARFVNVSGSVKTVYGVGVGGITICFSCRGTAVTQSDGTYSASVLAGEFMVQLDINSPIYASPLIYYANMPMGGSATANFISIPKPKSIALNTAAGDGYICSVGDENWFSVSLYGKTSYVVEVTNAWYCTLGDSTITRFDNWISEKETDDDGGDGPMSRLFVSTNSTGCDYVRVRGKGTSTGTYRIAASSLGTLVVGDPPVTENIWGAGAQRWYQFTTSAAGFYRIDTAAGTLTDNYLYLYDASHNDALAESEDGGPAGMARIDHWLAAGTYYVKVRARHADTAGTFQIGIASISATVTGIVWNYTDGTGIAGVTITFSGGRGSCVTKPDGSFSATVLYGEFTAAPSAPGWEFLPESRDVSLAAGGSSNLLFAGFPNPIPLLVDGPAVDGYIASTSETYWFKISFDADDDCIIETINAWGTLPDAAMSMTMWCAETPDAYWGWDGFPGTGDGGMARIVHLSQGFAHVAYLRVKGHTGTGSYKVTASTIRTWQVNSTISGVVPAPGAPEWARFEITTPRHYVLDMTAGTLADTVLSVYPFSPCDPIEVDDDDGDGNMARIIRHLPANTYYAKVRAYQSTASGTYSVRIHPAPEITPDGPAVEGAITAAGNQDWFAFTSPPGVCVVEVTNLWGHSLVNSVATVFDKDAKYLLTDDDGGDGALSRFSVAADGQTRYLHVKGGGSTGTYAVTVSLLSQIIAGGQPLTGEISGAGSSDWYQLVVNTAGGYRIDTAAGTLADTHLFLYENLQGDVIEEDADDGEGAMARIDCLLGPGVYYLKVRAPGASTGTYTISVGPASATISGRVATVDGIPLHGTTIRFGGGRGAAVVQPDGTYSVNVLPGEFPVTPSLGAWVFVPQQRSVSLANGATLENVDFIGLPGVGLIGVDCATRLADIPLVIASEYWLAFTIDAPGTYVAELSTLTGPTASASLAVYDHAMNILFSDENGGGDEDLPRIVAGLGPGPYYIRIQGGSGRDPLDGAVTLNRLVPIEEGVPQQAQMTCERAADWFMFHVPESGFTWRISTIPGGLTATRLTFYDSFINDPLVQVDGEGSMAYLDIPLPAGTYYVRVRASDPLGTGTYSILLARLTHAISGSIHKPKGSGIAGVTVGFGSRPAVVTDPGGSYGQSGFAHGAAETITPGMTGWRFRPRSISVTVDGDLAGQNFAGTIVADANYDCIVNVLDLIFIRNRLNQSISSGDNWQADVNDDGRINVLDLIFARNRLSTRCP